MNFVHAIAGFLPPTTSSLSGSQILFSRIFVLFSNGSKLCFELSSSSKRLSIEGADFFYFESDFHEVVAMNVARSSQARSQL